MALTQVLGFFRVLSVHGGIFLMVYFAAVIRQRIFKIDDLIRTVLNPEWVGDAIKGDCSEGIE